MENKNISTMLTTSALLALAACGGGSSAISNSPTILEDRILATRPGAPSQGIRKRLDSQGNLEIWFDNELTVIEDVTYILGTSVTGNSVEMYGASGDITGGGLLVIEGVQASNQPVGNHTYIGDAIITYKAVSASKNRTENFGTLGQMTANINFGTGTGTVRATTSDATAQLNINVIDIDSNGGMVGTGLFRAFGETFTVSTGFVGSIFYQESTFNYDAISEQSNFHGALFGNNSAELSGISIGQSHIIGVLGSR